MKEYCMQYAYHLKANLIRFPNMRSPKVIKGHVRSFWTLNILTYYCVLPKCIQPTYHSTVNWMEISNLRFFGVIQGHVMSKWPKMALNWSYYIKQRFKIRIRLNRRKVKPPILGTRLPETACKRFGIESSGFLHYRNLISRVVGSPFVRFSHILNWK